MKTSLVCFSLAVVWAFGATGHSAQLRWNADALVLRIEELNKLPPLAEGVSELKFADLYKLPVGSRGLELTEKVRALDGGRVRVLGFMVRQAKSAPGLLILAPYELATNEIEFGTSDDLPPSLIFVEVPKYEDLSVPFTPGPLLLTGTLEVGRREEADGRFSEVRLKLDESLPPAAGGSNITTASSSKS